MAKVTIELDTHDCDPRDERILAALSPNEAEAEIRPTPRAAVQEEPAPEAPKARRGRPPKVDLQPEPTPAPIGEVTTVTEPQTEASATDTPEEITLEQVNGKIKALFDKDVPALKVQEVIKAATDGRFGSARQIAEAGETHFFPIIMQGLEAL